MTYSWSSTRRTRSGLAASPCLRSFAVSRLSPISESSDRSHYLLSYEHYLYRLHCPKIWPFSVTWNEQGHWISSLYRPAPYHRAMPCRIEAIAIYTQPMNSIRSLSFSISTKQVHGFRPGQLVWEEKRVSEIESRCSINELLPAGLRFLDIYCTCASFLSFLIRRTFRCVCFPSITWLSPFEVLLELDFFLFCSRGFHYLLFISGKRENPGQLRIMEK